MAAKEILRIHNFAGIKDAEIEIGRMNIFIGPQASGKSVAAKLLYFFRQAARRMFSDAEITDAFSPVGPSREEQFNRYFPPSSLGIDKFEVRYSYGDLWIRVRPNPSAESGIEISDSAALRGLLARARDEVKKLDAEYERGSSSRLWARMAIVGQILGKDEQSLANRNYFVPTGRALLSSPRNVASLLASDIRLDPFLKEFITVYDGAYEDYLENVTHRRRSELYKRLKRNMHALMCGELVRVDSRVVVKSNDGRSIPVEVSSSGQQEALPLAVMLVHLARGRPLDHPGETMFIEEPETHLYPNAQREIVRMMSDVVVQYIVTTHSPYMLTAINNLMLAGQILRNDPSKRPDVARIVGEASPIDPQDVRAYGFEDGHVRSIIDPETYLVLARELDTVSGDLAREFEELLDIAYAKDAA
jgi:hypothetical protein